MGLLENFEEEKEIKTTTTPKQDEAIELIGVLKTKEAELKLELEHIKKLNKFSEENIKKVKTTLEKIEIVLEKVVNLIENNDKKFTEETTELKNINQNFIETLENSEFLYNLQKYIEFEIKTIQKEANKKIIEIEDKIDKEIVKLKNSYGFREVIAWVLTTILCILWAFSHFTYKGEIREYRQEIKEYQEISKNQYNKILNILTENEKFWYSSKDKNAYFGSKEQMKELKEKEAKNSKK